MFKKKKKQKTAVCFVVTLSLFTQDLGLSSLDVMLLLFGRVLALIEIGQPEVARTRIISSVAIFCHFIVNPKQIMFNTYSCFLCNSFFFFTCVLLTTITLMVSLFQCRNWVKQRKQWTKLCHLRRGPLSV